MRAQARKSRIPRVNGRLSRDPADLEGTSTYHYSVKSGTSWSSADVADAGDSFSGQGEPYLGGAQLPDSTPGGVVWLCREYGGNWTLEKCSTADGGDTWSVERKDWSSALPITRAWPIETQDATPAPFEYVANYINDLTFYFTNFDAHCGPSRDAIT